MEELILVFLKFQSHSPIQLVVPVRLGRPAIVQAVDMPKVSILLEEDTKNKHRNITNSIIIYDKNLKQMV